MLASVLQAASPRSSRPFHLKYAALPQAGSYVPYDNWVSSLEAAPRSTRARGARRAPHRAEQTSSRQKTRRVLGDAGSAEPLERRSGSFDTVLLQHTHVPVGATHRRCSPVWRHGRQRKLERQ